MPGQQARAIERLHMEAFPDLKHGQIVLGRTCIESNWFLLMRCDMRRRRKRPAGYVRLTPEGKPHWITFKKVSRLCVRGGMHPVNDFQPTGFLGDGTTRWVTPPVLQTMKDVLLDLEPAYQVYAGAMAVDPWP